MHYTYKCYDCSWVSIEMGNRICPNCDSNNVRKISSKMEVIGIYYGKEFISFKGMNEKFKNLFLKN